MTPEARPSDPLTRDVTIFQLMEAAREFLPLSETAEGCEILARDADKFFPAVLSLLLTAKRVRAHIDAQSKPRLRRVG